MEGGTCWRQQWHDWKEHLLHAQLCKVEHTRVADSGREPIGGLAQSCIPLVQHSIQHLRLHCWQECHLPVHHHHSCTSTLHHPLQSEYWQQAYGHALLASCQLKCRELKHSTQKCGYVWLIRRGYLQMTFMRGANEPSDGRTMSLRLQSTT